LHPPRLALPGHPPHRCPRRAKTRPRPCDPRKGCAPEPH
jgi:hypothetical protein